MLIYGSVGGTLLLIVIIAAASSGGGTSTPEPTTPERPAVQAVAPRTTSSGFVDDGKWRQYIQIPVPNEPGEADARELRKRVNDLLYYAQNLEGEDRNSIYRYIVQLCQKAAESNSMPENWRQHFNKEWAQARRYITR